MFSLTHLLQQNFHYRPFRRFWRARDGAVAIYASFASVVMIGFGALVVDAGRAYTLQTELQHSADAAALAGAAELDRTATSITRAQTAAKTALIKNLQTFASGGQDVVIEDTHIRFLSSLPADDDAPIPNSSVTNDPLFAGYIEVTPSVREVNYLLAPVVAMLTGDPGGNLTKGKASATAVAGLECVVCNFPPLMICNPAESNGNTGAPFNPVPGQLIELKQGGGTGAWTPGNFGLLDPYEGNQGTANLVQSLASTNPGGCYSATVDLRTGSATNPVSTAMNTRFDMYENPGFGGGAKNNSDYRPAPNVVKGKYKDGNGYVNYAGSPPTGRAMPKHDCYGANNCASLGPSFHPRFAPPEAANLTAQTSFWAEYWGTNHPSDSFGTHYLNGNLDPNGDGIVTRKEMYDWEVANAIPTGDANGDGSVSSDDETAASSATGENGRPTNYAGSAAPDPMRRVMYVAVINCVEHGPLNGNSSGVPVLAYAKMFLTHPAEGGSEPTIYAEVISAVEPDADSTVLHDIVQLYR
jgi:Flp pilus assembly protein TadG